MRPRDYLWLPLLLSLIFLTAWRQVLPAPSPTSPIYFPAREDNFSSSSPSLVPLSEKSTLPVTTTSTPECPPNTMPMGGVISGTIGGWYCIVDEDLIVPAGETLIIDSSTTLSFAFERRMIVAGRVETTGAQVTFKGIDEAGWDGLHFEASAAGSVCNNASGQNGLRLWDISEPNRPIEVDNFEAPGFALDVASQDDYIYLANGDGGLYILRYNGQE